MNYTLAKGIAIGVILVVGLHLGAVWNIDSGMENYCKDGVVNKNLHWRSDWHWSISFDCYKK